MRRSRRHVEVVDAAQRLDLHVLRALIIGSLEGRQVRRIARIHRRHAVGVRNGECTRQREAVCIRERNPGERTRSVRDAAIADAEHERLSGGEVVGLAALDFAEVGRRRVIAKGVDTEKFVDDWMNEENVFLAEHRPWDVADVVVAGELGQPALTGRYGNVVTASGPVQVTKRL